MNIGPSIGEALQQRCVEPRKRMVAGQFGWAIHRFPIKNGIALQVALSRALADSISKPSFFSKLMRTA